MSEIEQAAERLRKVRQNVREGRAAWISSVYDPGATGDCGNADYTRDLHALAYDHPLLASRPVEAREEAIDEAWLRSIGFRTKQYQGGAPLALKISGGPIADPQWIETTDLDGAFLLCRWSPMYDDDTPPDRISVVASTRSDLLRLLTALGLATPASAEVGK